MKAPGSTGARVFAFNLVGILGFVVQLGLLWLLVHVFRLPVLPATALAVEGAIIHNFLWHWRWTWNDRAPSPGGRAACFLRFNASNGAVSLFVNVALMAFLNLLLHVPYLIANAGAVCCASAANYLLGDRVVFPREGSVVTTPRSTRRQTPPRCGTRSRVISPTLMRHTDP